MRDTRILILSLGLNLLLIASLAVQKATKVFSPAQKPPVKIVHKTNIVLETNAGTAALTKDTVIPFHWRELESEDYHIYMANLRSVGCPERVVENIILQDIDQSFTDRPKPLKPLWLTGSKHRKWEQSEKQFEAKLATEKADLIRTLLGFEADAKTRRLWAEEDDGIYVIGFLTDHQAEQVLAIASRHGSLFEFIFDEEILTPQNLAYAREQYESMIQRFQTVASPSEVEEGMLRMYSTLTSLHRFEGAQKISAANRRAFAALFMREVTPLDWLLHFSTPQSEGPQFSVQFLTEAPKLIGTEAFVSMMGNEMMGSLCETLKQSGRPVSDVLPVFLVQKAASEEAASIRNTPGLSHAEKRAKLQALREEVMEAVVGIIGEPAQKTLTSSTANWWAELGVP